MKYLKLIGMGVLLFLVLTLVEFAVTIPLGMPASEADDVIHRYLTWEFLLSAVPAGLLSYAAARLMKLSNRTDLLTATIIWTMIHVLWMLLIAIGNDRLVMVFGHFAFYVRLAVFFIGPFLVLLKPVERFRAGHTPKML